ncbi:hypothetical protein TNCV_415411 [Trichonephila clavipes]|nr:hypothetical protein TNCV_415411 [Trichonephila clavipes]
MTRLRLTTLQEESDSVDDETDEDEDNNNENRMNKIRKTPAAHSRFKRDVEGKRSIIPVFIGVSYCVIGRIRCIRCR